MIDDNNFINEKSKRGRKKSKTVITPNIGAKPTSNKKASSIGSPFPNVNTYFSGRRIDCKLLEQTARAPPVARSLWQLQLIAFPWFEFNIIPPANQEPDEDKDKDLKIKLEEIERRIKTTIMCSQAMYDVITYGSALFELTWKEDEDGYVVPDVVQRLPAQSFRQAPAGAIGDRTKYVVGNILKGIVYNKAEKSYEYYQLQDPYGSTGVPVQIPSEQLIHIKDTRSAYVDGEPYLAGITSTISQLEFVRKRVMQTVTRIGSPKQIATVGIPPSYLKALEANQIPMSVTSAVPGATGTAADTMLTDLWDMARVIVENQNSDIAVAVPEGIKLEWERPSIPFNPTEIDAYLIKEAIYHIFPRDILEVAAQAISTTSSPLLELLKMMVQGWQSLCTTQFESQLWNKFLELNGFEGYRIEIDWASLIPPDQQKIESLAIQKFNMHLITLNEARAEIGLPVLDDAPWMKDLTQREILEKELTIWRTGGQQQQGGMGGMFGGGMEGEQPVEGEPAYDEYGNETNSEEYNPEDTLSEAEDLLAGLKEEQESPKQNMSLDGFTTPKDVDLKFEEILKSIEPDVMEALDKTKYFNKKE
jgi:hypothetical protein